MFNLTLINNLTPAFATYSTKHSKAVVATILLLTLSACGHDDNNDNQTPTPIEYSYSVAVTNLTYAQPLSPLGVTLHADSKMWMIGEAASESLEKLAEGGDNTDFIADTNALASSSGDSVILPSATSTVEISTTDRNANFFTAATMLVNTNDAFSGLNALDLGQLAVGDSWSSRMRAYDSGTEANSEAAGTIPGPADSGTGVDAERDDVDFVAAHPGVVTSADNLPTSVLNSQHKFDNPVMSITVTRTE